MSCLFVVRFVSVVMPAKAGIQAKSCVRSTRLIRLDSSLRWYDASRDEATHKHIAYFPTNSSPFQSAPTIAPFSGATLPAQFELCQ
jgi:hypothetical protein